MTAILDRSLGVHSQLLNFRIERSKVLASNLANADTPGFQAKDLDFSTMVRRLQSNSSDVNNYKVGYRIPFQESDDENTVEVGNEQAIFSQNAMDFQTGLTFLNMKINGLRSAIEGR